MTLFETLRSVSLVSFVLTVDALWFSSRLFVHCSSKPNYQLERNAKDVTYFLLRWWERYSVFAVYYFLKVDKRKLKRSKAKACKKEFWLGISCFERKLFNHILCLLGLAAMCWVIPLYSFYLWWMPYDSSRLTVYCRKEDLESPIWWESSKPNLLLKRKTKDLTNFVQPVWEE